MTATGSGAPDVQALNRQMAERITTAPAEPYAEGAHAMRVVETRGRRTGEPRRTPVGVVTVGGGQYLVSPVRERDWPRNLLADGRCVLLAGGERDPRTAVALDADALVPVVRAYLLATKVPWALKAFPVGVDASDDEIHGAADAMAAFRLDPRDET